jgi:photosystem II stability/assembly factor-like uncharacterized protein
LKQILRLNPKNEKANDLLNKLLKPPLASSIPSSASTALPPNPIVSTGKTTKKGGKPRRIAIAISFAVLCCVGSLAGILSVPGLMPANVEATPTNAEAMPVEKIIEMTFSAAGSQTAVFYPTPSPTPTPAPTSTSTVTPTTTATLVSVETNPRPVKPNVWTNRGLEDQTIYSLAIDPKTPTTLYAGTYGEGGGVFKTTDGGANWNAVNSGLTSVIINSLAIDPLTPSTLYAGTGNRGMFKSTDGGANWNTANTGLTNFTVAALAIDPTTPSTLYAGTSGGGVFKSTDGGANWSAVNTGLMNRSTTNTSLPRAYVSALAIDPTMPTTLYAGTLDGVFKSIDGGANWSIGIINPTDIHVVSLAIDPTVPTTIYAGTYSWGVFKSTDGGANWSKSHDGLTWSMDILTLVIDPTLPTTIYAGTFNLGVFKSADGGGSWNPSGTGLNVGVVCALVLDTQMPTTLYAGTWNHGVFVTH